MSRKDRINQGVWSVSLFMAGWIAQQDHAAGKGIGLDLALAALFWGLINFPPRPVTMSEGGSDG